MDYLRTLARSDRILSLVDEYLSLPDVEGIALGVHLDFIEHYYAEFGRTQTMDEALQSEKIPERWAQECDAQGFPQPMSPVYIAFYVAKLPPGWPFDYGRFPRTIDNYTTVVEQRFFVGFHDRKRHRPMPGGVSVSGDQNGATGTIGGFVVDQSKHAYLMSCWHVLCDGNANSAVQQGMSHGGHTPKDVVGKIHYSIAPKPAKAFNKTAPYDDVDAALAEVQPQDVDPMIRILRQRVGATEPSAQVDIGDDVVFVGKESDRREATVFRHIARTKVRIHGQTYLFGDIFEIEPRHHIYIGRLAVPGDSGSWVVREVSPEKLTGYGILFAGSGKHALCCYLENVLSRLNAAAGTTFDYA